MSNGWGHFVVISPPRICCLWLLQSRMADRGGGFSDRQEVGLKTGGGEKRLTKRTAWYHFRFPNAIFLDSWAVCHLYITSEKNISLVYKYGPPLSHICSFMSDASEQKREGTWSSIPLGQLQCLSVMEDALEKSGFGVCYISYPRSWWGIICAAFRALNPRTLVSTSRWNRAWIMNFMVAPAHASHKKPGSSPLVKLRPSSPQRVFFVSFIATSTKPEAWRMFPGLLRIVYVLVSSN